MKITKAKKEDEVSVTPVDNKSATNGRAKSNRKLITVIIIGLLGFVIIIVGIFGVGLYAFGWNDKITSTVIKVVPYPAVKVGSSYISYNAYREDVNTLQHFYSTEEAQAGPIPTDVQIDELALNRLVRDLFTERLAKDHDIDITQEAIDEQFSDLVAEAGSEAEVDRTLAEFYNWDADTFIQRVIVPFLYREELTAVVQTETGANTDAEATATDILEQLKNGADFAELAAENSADAGTKDDGGSLGSFGRGVMVPAFEEAVFALDVGELSDLVQTEFGFHIIKLDAKQTVELDDGTEVEEVTASHILIAGPDVDSWISEQLAETNISLYVSGFMWDKSLGRVVNETITE